MDNPLGFLRLCFLLRSKVTDAFPRFALISGFRRSFWHGFSRLQDATVVGLDIHEDFSRKIRRRSSVQWQQPNPRADSRYCARTILETLGHHAGCCRRLFIPARDADTHRDQSVAVRWTMDLAKSSWLIPLLMESGFVIRAAYSA